MPLRTLVAVGRRAAFRGVDSSPPSAALLRALRERRAVSFVVDALHCSRSFLSEATAECFHERRGDPCIPSCVNSCVFAFTPCVPFWPSTGDLVLPAPTLSGDRAYSGVASEGHTRRGSLLVGHAGEGVRGAAAVPFPPESQSSHTE